MRDTLAMMTELCAFAEVRELEAMPALYKADHDPRIFAAAFKGVYRFALKKIKTYNIDNETKVSIVLERLHFALTAFDGRGKFLTLYGKVLTNALNNAQRGEAFKMRYASGYFAPLELPDEDGIMRERVDFKQTQSHKVELAEPLTAEENDCLWALNFAKRPAQAKKYMLKTYGAAGLQAIGQNVKRKLVYN